jgi:leucyl-tRNA synthetase
MRKLHQTIKKVSEDLARAELQHAVAAMMEYMNVVRLAERSVHRAEIEPLVQLVAPFAPHVAEDLWERLGHDRSVFDSGWPVFDASLAAEELITIAVQVGGKTRGTVQLPPGANQDAAMEAGARRRQYLEVRCGSAKKDHLRSRAPPQHRRVMGW